MPVYEFVCESCGPFEQWRSMGESGADMSCPECGEAARRLYTAPAIRRMSAGLYRALDRAEKSASEPEVVRKPGKGRDLRSGHRHGPGRPWALGHG
ncbi:zinc ribbon domain-containing protein [Rubrobacter taiwanensis]|uniref:Zinc ribbon domain-containing protein n=1 Tax=Rubrobacter taiwanensis TaxID=185139 RepID=A0A4R1BG11_9ACTN|nr:zinc ribbon domain-containing protein [Rubrobacter taiwanensis]